MPMDKQRQSGLANAAQCGGLKRFILKLVGFAALQLGLFAMVEFRLSQTPNPYNIKKARLQSYANTRILLLGSSHILNGLNPDELGVPAINLAGYSQDLYYDSQLVLRSLDQMPALECVVLGISYFTLEYDMEDSSEEWRSCYYRRYFGIPHRHWVNEFDPRNFSLFLLYGPDISRQVLVGQQPALSAFVQANGWAANPVPDDPTTAVSDGPARVEVHHDLMHLENIARNLEILDELLDVLHQRGIEVVLLTTPVYQSYSARFDPVREARFHEAIAHLQSRYGARYLDFTSDQRFDVRDFYNSDHLNRDGATKLSRLVGRDLLAIVSDNHVLRVSSQKPPKEF
jgi:hypothetical protein